MRVGYRGVVTTRRGPYAKGVARRIQVLTAAEALVLEHGHEATTMRLVAERVGVTEAALYYHFPSKDVLLVELLRFRDDRSRARFEGVDLVETLLRIVEENQAEPAVIRLIASMAAGASDPRHPAHAYFRERYQRMTHEFAASLQRRLSGEVSEERVAEIANLLIAGADGLQTRWLIDPTIDMVAHLRVLTDAVLGGDHDGGD